MSAKQIYWDLLHAKKKLEDFSDHAREVSETKPYNTQFTSALHRIYHAIERMKQVLKPGDAEALEEAFFRVTGGKTDAPKD